MAKPKKALTALAPSTVEDRVRHIAQLMADCQWVRGQTYKDLAKQWGLPESNLKNYTAEASRLIRYSVDGDVTQMRATWWAQVQSLKQKLSVDTGANARELTKLLELESRVIFDKVKTDLERQLPDNVVDQFRNPEPQLAEVLDKALAEPGDGLVSILERNGWYKVVEND